MQLKNTTATYGAISKFLHWIVALLVVGLLIVGFVMGDIGDKHIRMQVYNIHKLLGLGVLLLMLLRVMWRIINIQPKYPATVPNWEQRAARAVHDVIYLCLIAMPLSGWIMSTASGHAPHIAGWTMNAPGLAESKELGYLGAKLHFWLAWAIPGVVLLHIAAAFKHHWYYKNEVLLRMLPGTKIDKSDFPNRSL